MIDIVAYTEWMLAHTKPEKTLDQYGRESYIFGTNIVPVKQSYPSPVSFHTLAGFCNYINLDPDEMVTKYESFVQIISPFSVAVMGRPDEWGQRPLLAGATHEHKEFEKNEFSWHLEECLIKLKTHFAENEHQKYLLELLSTWVVDDQESYTDNGIAQVVTRKKGVTRVGEHTVVNELELLPYMTFPEIDPQPVTYNLRLKMHNGNPIVLLTAYKDLRWRLKYMDAIAEFIVERSGNTCQVIR